MKLAEINRKDSLMVLYLINTTNQNITSYTDTVSSSGRIGIELILLIQMVIVFKQT